jgi:hypothetical protein
MQEHDENGKQKTEQENCKQSREQGDGTNSFCGKDDLHDRFLFGYE